MCGICGIFYPDPRRHAERDTLAAMNAQIVHRGPDDDGFFVEGNVGVLQFGFLRARQLSRHQAAM